MRPITDLQRKVNPFQVISDYIPSGDQPTAIAQLAERINAGESDVVLLGATGTGKSATTAWLIEKLQRPTLVLAPNKTLAAQLANEFRELMPNNAVEYFVSYYDYYQPEAYVPQTDTFIEKDSSVNSEVERLRHSATNSLLTRRDVIVVATVSCIYGLGTPQEYVDRMIKLQVGESIERNALLRRFVDIQYKRNDMAFERGTDRHQFVVGGRHGGFHRLLAGLRSRGGHWLGRADAGDDVLALRVDQIFAVENVFPGGRIAGEAHASGAIGAHIAEHHRLDVDRSAPIRRDVMQAAISVGARVFPAAEDRANRAP